MTTKKDEKKEFTPFHSAVNRIPVLRTEAQQKASDGELSSDLFEDRVAVGHDHLHKDRWTGSIDLEITVRTPLVFGEQDDFKASQEDGTTQNVPAVEVPQNADRSPLVPPTMIKGMVSRAYETLTCSRFRVFGEHEDGSEVTGSGGHVSPLTYRCGPSEALRLIPARVESVDSETRSVTLELLYGETLKGARKWERGFSCLLRAASLPAPTGNSDTKNVGHYKLVAGKNGFQGERWFDAKHDERVFFRGLKKKVIAVADAPTHDSYLDIVRSYLRLRQEQRASALPLSKQERPNRVTVAASKTARPRDLKAGDLLYAILSDESYGEDGSIIDTSEKITVVGMVPTMVGRRSYRASPASHAAEQKVAPLTDHKEASSADRVFGYVIQKSPKTQGGDVASRGHVSFRPVSAPEGYVSSESIELSPLLSPKPSSARRFLTDCQGRTLERTRSNLFAPNTPNNKGDYLGRAAYPVHRLALEAWSFPPQARCPVAEDENLNVRLVARSWIRKGAVLRCRLSFTNLSKSELGALLWVLTPENLVPDREQNQGRSKVGYLQMGLGKPYGLGAVEVRVSEGGLRARRGDEYADLYQTLFVGHADEQPPVKTVDEFSLAQQRELSQTAWVKAMQRAAFGYGDGVEVRYMSLEENKKNNVRNAAISPRNLWGDESDQPIRISQ